MEELEAMFQKLKDDVCRVVNNERFRAEKAERENERLDIQCAKLKHQVDCVVGNRDV